MSEIIVEQETKKQLAPAPVSKNWTELDAYIKQQIVDIRDGMLKHWMYLL